jgi:hypothetical protein
VSRAVDGALRQLIQLGLEPRVAQLGNRGVEDVGDGVGDGPEPQPEDLRDLLEIVMDGIVRGMLEADLARPGAGLGSKAAESGRSCG